MCGLVWVLFIVYLAGIGWYGYLHTSTLDRLTNLHYNIQSLRVHRTPLVFVLQKRPQVAVLHSPFGPMEVLVMAESCLQASMF
jgi:hypothetical protein